MTNNSQSHNNTQDAILENMFDRSMSVMQPTFNIINKQNDEDYNEAFNNYLQIAKQEWLEMMRRYLSSEEIDCLVQAFFYTSKIDEQKLLLFNTVFTKRVVELAEQHFV